MTWRVEHGDCVERMRALPDASVDAIVTDPPYGLEFMGKEWDGADGFRCSLNGADVNRDNPFGRASRTSPEYRAGALYHAWCEAWAIEALRVLKPGGHLLAFGGTRTYHRLTCAIEDAGFEIRDCITWLYGSGFPKSLDVSKAIDKAAGAKREVVATSRSPFRMADPYIGNVFESTQSGDTRKVDADGYIIQEQTGPATAAAERWQGWGTALKPAFEPIVVARKPLAGTVAANVLTHGTGSLNVDGCRIATADDLNGGAYSTARKPSDSEWVKHGGTIHSSTGETFVAPAGRWPANVALSHDDECVHVGTAAVRSTGHHPRARPAGSQTSGPAGHIGQRELAERRTAGESVPVWACVPGCPVRMLDDHTGTLTSGANPTRRNSDKFRTAYGEFDGQRECVRVRGIDKGGASRFFYCAKANKRERHAGLNEHLPRTPNRRKRCQQDTSGRWLERARNTHPTVKPIAVMRWLVRLVTPPDGVVLDPFVGSGTTGIAAGAEGMRFIGIERDRAYVEIAKARIAGAHTPPPVKRRGRVAATGQTSLLDDGGSA